MPWRQQRWTRPFRYHTFLYECDSERVHPGRHRKADVQCSIRVCDVIPTFGILGGVQTFSRGRPALAADSEPCDPGAIQQNVDLVARVNTANHRASEVSSQTDRHHVFAVEREVIVNEGTTPRSYRKIVTHAVILPETARDLKRFHRRTRRRIPDGEPTDFPRRQHVPFQQGRRNR